MGIHEFEQLTGARVNFDTPSFPVYNQRVDLELSTEGGRTVLTFVQVFGADADVTEFAMGWHWYLEKFGAEVAGTPVPGVWDDFLAEVGPAYGRG